MNEHAKVGSGKTIAVIGVGGTGSALLPLLGTMPISSVTVVDGDTVAAVNLIRQPLYDP